MSPVSMILVVLTALALAAAIAAAFALLRDRSGAQGSVQTLDTRFAELLSRLAQIGETSQIAQSQMAERLQAQERLLQKMVEERLAELSRRLGETLEKSALKSDSTIAEVKERLAVIDAAQKNLTDLSTQVVGLQEILNNKQARGAFGEVQLENLVQSVLPPSAYRFQAPLGDGKRVDCLLQLPNPPGPIAIDAKFPLDAYRALREAADDGARKAAAARFVQDMRRHIADIADKYIVAGETAEAALLFLPSETIYAELHVNFQSVVDESYRARVFIVSPTTLWATLNTIRAVLKDVHMREQAGVIQEQVRLLLGDMKRLDERVGNLQTHFRQANDDIRDIRISTDKVTKRGERIEELELEETAGDNVAEIAAAPTRLQSSS